MTMRERSCQIIEQIEIVDLNLLTDPRLRKGRTNAQVEVIDKRGLDSLL